MEGEGKGKGEKEGEGRGKRNGEDRKEDIEGIKKKGKREEERKG